MEPWIYYTKEADKMWLIDKMKVRAFRRSDGFCMDHPIGKEQAKDRISRGVPLVLLENK